MRTLSSIASISGVICIIGMCLCYCAMILLNIIIAFSISALVGIIFLFFGITGPIGAVVLGLIWGEWVSAQVGLLMIPLFFITLILKNISE